MARLRFCYGPDLISISKRVLILAITADLKCRWCAAEQEDSEHLLLRCVVLRRITSSIWEMRMVSCVGDKADWSLVESNMKETYDRCSDSHGY